MLIGPSMTEKEPQGRGKYYRAERKVPVPNLSLLFPKCGGGVMLHFPSSLAVRLDHKPSPKE